MARFGFCFGSSRGWSANCRSARLARCLVCCIKGSVEYCFFITPTLRTWFFFGGCYYHPLCWDDAFFYISFFLQKLYEKQIQIHGSVCNLKDRLVSCSILGQLGDSSSQKKPNRTLMIQPAKHQGQFLVLDLKFMGNPIAFCTLGTIIHWMTIGVAGLCFSYASCWLKSCTTWDLKKPLENPVKNDL